MPTSMSLEVWISLVLNRGHPQLTKLPKETQGGKNLRYVCVDNIKISNIEPNSRTKFKFVMGK